jgi:hypothetical protein
MLTAMNIMAIFGANFGHIGQIRAGFTRIHHRDLRSLASINGVYAAWKVSRWERPE